MQCLHSMHARASGPMLSRLATTENTRTAWSQPPTLMPPCPRSLARRRKIARVKSRAPRARRSEALAVHDGRARLVVPARAGSPCRPVQPATQHVQHSTNRGRHGRACDSGAPRQGCTQAQAEALAASPALARPGRGAHSLLAIHICWKVESEARMEPPIQTLYLRSGGATTLTFMDDGARCVISLFMRSAMPGNIVVPAARARISSPPLAPSRAGCPSDTLQCSACSVVDGRHVAQPPPPHQDLPHHRAAPSTSRRSAPSQAARGARSAPAARRRTAGQDDVAVQVLADVHIALHD